MAQYAERRLAFGLAAEQYDLIRPGYPAPLVDAVLAHCGGPGITALEAELSFYGQVFGFTPPGTPVLELRR